MNKFDIEKVELKICKLYTNEFEEFHFPRNLTGINHDQEDILRLKKNLQDSIPGNRKKINRSRVRKEISLLLFKFIGTFSLFSNLT